MYWRIVRINGDGTIRLVYDGTTKNQNGTAHTANIGFEYYGGGDLNVNYGDSDVKDVVDTWYNTNLKTSYETYISDGIFCNDKEVASVEYFDEEWEETTAENAWIFPNASSMRPVSGSTTVCTTTRSPRTPSRTTSSSLKATSASPI